jgi:hypothetical protein
MQRQSTILIMLLLINMYDPRSGTVKISKTSVINKSKYPYLALNFILTNESNQLGLSII